MTPIQIMQSRRAIAKRLRIRTRGGGKNRVPFVPAPKPPAGAP